MDIKSQLEEIRKEQEDLRTKIKDLDKKAADLYKRSDVDYVGKYIKINKYGTEFVYLKVRSQKWAPIGLEIEGVGFVLDLYRVASYIGINDRYQTTIEFDEKTMQLKTANVTELSQDEFKEKIDRIFKFANSIYERCIDKE